MGYMRHHAIVVTSFVDMTEARDTARRLGNTTTEIVASPINRYATFLVVPDGSKEGWINSDIGDTAREGFIDWLEAQPDGSNNYDWAEVMYGDDEGFFSIRTNRRAFAEGTISRG